MNGESKGIPILPTIAPGTYRHHKTGDHYKVLFTATHSESLEPLVIYQALYGDMRMWARPYSMFIEEIQWNGRTVLRFEKID